VKSRGREGKCVAENMMIIVASLIVVRDLFGARQKCYRKRSYAYAQQDCLIVSIFKK